jgi:hypothetical protein
MKIIRGFAKFLVLSIFIITGSCVSEPEFSAIPEIGNVEVKFVITPNPDDADTLFLELSFKDGDGDLGLPEGDILYNSTPFNSINFFLEQNGSRKSVGSSMIYRDDVNTLSPILDIPEGTDGMLVTLATRDKPGHGDLPAYQHPYNRTAYVYDTIYIREGDKAILGDPNDPDFLTPVDTLKVEGRSYYALLETFYYQPNENYTNIDVTFKLPNGDNFDWTKTDVVISPFNERFPVLGDSGPLEGKLRYAMSYTGFLDDFGTNQIRLEVQIKDRALHKSNVATSKLFSFR